MLTQPMAEHLAALAHLLRADLANRTGCPTWDVAGIMKQLREVARFPAEDVALAVIRAAVDQGAHTPGVISALDGPHWIERISERRAPRSPMPSEECPDHPGQFWLSCSSRPPCGEPKARHQSRRDVVPAPDLSPVRDELRAARDAYHAEVQRLREARKA